MNLTCFCSLFFAAMLALTACKKEKVEATENFDCVNAQADNAPTLNEANARIVGNWQLKKMAGMRMPPVEIPNIRLVFAANKTVEVYQNNQLVHSDSYQLKEEKQATARWIAISTAKQTFQNGDYSFLRGTVRVCEAELLIDNGMAFDAPAYFFVKH